MKVCKSDLVMVVSEEVGFGGKIEILLLPGVWGGSCYVQEW